MYRKIKRNLIIALTLLLMFSLLNTMGALASNGTIISNGGFEGQLINGNLPGWTITQGAERVSLNTVLKTEGQQSLRIIKEDTNTVGVTMSSDRVNVTGAKEYILSMDLYLERGDLAGFYVYVYDSQGNIIKNTTGGDFTLFVRRTLNDVSGVVKVPKNEWTSVEERFLVPAGGSTLDIKLITSRSATTNYKYNLDNISLVQANDPDPVEIPQTAVKVDSSNAAQKEILGGLQSVVPFQNVEFTAETMVYAGSGGKIDLRFYDADNKILSIVSTKINGPVREWDSARVVASAPLNAAKVQTAMHFPGTEQGVFYADELNLQVKQTTEASYIKNLGPQSMTTTAMYGAYGKYKGRDVLYTVVQGSPAELAIIDVNNNTLMGRHQLRALDGSDVTAAWGVTVATDGKAYMGSTPNGTLFQFDPVTDELKTLGKPVPNDTVIWVLESGDNGKIYGGTGYSQSIFEYDPNATTGNGMKILKSFGGVKPDQHIRSLAYDPVNKVLYAGAADVAKLYRIDTVTGNSTLIPIPNSSGKTSVYDLEFAGGKLFVRVDAGPLMYVYDPAADQWDMQGNNQYNARGFSPVSPDNRVFYTFPVANQDGTTQFKLYQYNVNTNAYGPIDVNVKGVAVAYGYVELEDPDFPGVSLVGMAGNNGMSFWYNLQNGNVKTLELPLPSQFAEIHNIGKGLDGNILTSGFISGGGLGIYSPDTDTTELKPLLGQVEGYANLNGKTYFGIYPNAVLFEYDSAQEWNRTDSSKPMNPLRIGPLGLEQDRPIAMVGVESVNKLFIGTYPKAGQIGGALSIFDPVTRTFDVKRNIVQDHSINTMVYKDGLLYMGTGAMNGGSAQLAVYDIATNQIVSSHVPVAGKKAIASLMWGPDGNIWGMALGTLFIFDPVTKTVIYQDDIFPTADYSHSNARLQVGKDNNVYGSMYTGYVADNTYTSKMFKIDRVTKKMTIIFESNVDKLMQDDYGNFYFKYGSLLMKYSDPALVKPIPPVYPITLEAATNVNGINVQLTRDVDAAGKAKDEMTLDESKVNELLGQLAKKQSSIVITLPDHLAGVHDRNIVITSEAAKLLSKAKVELVAAGSEGQVAIPGLSLQGPKEDIYIRIMPVSDANVKSDLETRANKDKAIKKAAKNAKITIAAQPLTIYSNLHNRPITITIPTDSNLQSAANSKQLGVYIEYTDGKKELIRAKSFELNGKNALQFEVDKFSMRQKPGGLTAAIAAM
ncbi:carbohydrate binding domain-containing protein [Paenibacillus sp. IITD108]|uniref:carbohydrate binding domain-containing protein n=1 Tax=Paenibacillus sp. IITD108 TaxID=3116649 RepID=UPI002F4254ED